MKRFFLAVVPLLLFSSIAFSEDLAVELHFDTKPPVMQPQAFSELIRSLRPVRIQAFSDRRGAGETNLGELKANGLSRKIQSRTAVSVYATDAFRKIYEEWGGAMSQDAALVLAGEITDFNIEESDGYQARVGFHFILKDGEGKVIWDGHSSGVVRGSGRELTSAELPSMFNNLLRETYTELLEDDKLIGVWSGRVGSTYIIGDKPESTPKERTEG